MEAPSSPRSAALYYWGGDNSSNGIMDDDTFHWEEVLPDLQKKGHPEPRMNLGSDSNMHPISGERWPYGGRRQLKFTLSMDEDDHWMFVKPHSAISLGGCFVDTGAPVDEEKDEECCEAVADETIDELNNLGTEDGTKSEVLGAQETVEEITDDFNSIPIVDLSLPLEGPDGHASQIAAACRTSGFFYIINHGVDRKIMRAVMECSQRFFGLQLQDKFASGQNAGGNGYRGYFGIGMEDLDNKDGTRDLAKEEGASKSKGDQKEGFDCGLECIEGYHENLVAKTAYHDFFGENCWPDEATHECIAGFRETLIEYQKALLKLSDTLMTALAVSLKVPMDFFIGQSRNPMCTLRLLHYPPTPNLPQNKSSELLKSPTGCGAHTDYGLFTILQQDDIGGLQIRNKSNAWIDALPLAGSFVINMGDMLSWWTEGEYASTVHRVVSPAWMGGENEETGNHRYSIPFFFNPDHDAVVEPVGSTGAASGGNSGGKTAIEILKQRYAGTFKSK